MPCVDVWFHGKPFKAWLSISCDNEEEKRLGDLSQNEPHLTAQTAVGQSTALYSYVSTSMYSMQGRIASKMRKKAGLALAIVCVRVARLQLPGSPMLPYSLRVPVVWPLNQIKPPGRNREESWPTV
jgi:hypothetical protein